MSNRHCAATDYSHSHVTRQHHQGHTLLLNPGAIYHANPQTLAVVELPGLVVHGIEM
jgi:hypothetical protein